MRYVVSAIGGAAVLLVVGCSHFPFYHPDRASGTRTSRGQSPTAEQLVHYLNASAQKLQSLQCRDLDLDCRQKLQAFHVSGNLMCQKPRNFRLIAKSPISDEADFGSNDQEFWFWVKRGEPYIFHCAHTDYARGVQVGFPFQPEWVMEALGMAEYPLDGSYRVVPQEKSRTFELVQQTKSQGRPIRKVIVFNQDQSLNQVQAYILQDERGKEICSARVTQSQVVQGVVVPKRVQFSWPDQNLEMKMKLDEVVVNQVIEPQWAAALFNRPSLANVPAYDLARGPEAPRGGGVQRAGAFAPQR